jgi:hypothetical protein
MHGHDLQKEAKRIHAAEIREEFEAEGMSGLNDKRDVPRNIPHKTSES